jgi:hypothetical protein
MKTILLALTATFSLASVHCAGSSTAANGTGGGSGEGATTLTTSPSDFCHAVCTRVNACDSTADVDTCANECENGFASVYPKLRGDIVANVEHCWQEKDCKTVLSSTSAFASCIDEAEASVAPTSTGTAFCDGLDASWKKCGESLDRAKCLGLVKEYNDDTLTAAGKCLDKACADVDGCIAATLGLDAQGSAPSGPPDSTSSSGSSGPSGPSTPPSH